MVLLLRPQRSSDLGLFDGFCGAGGSSLGCAWLGLVVKLAINHNASSLATHRRNFPNARHDCLDITSIPFEHLHLYPDAQLAWFSAECTYHSTASGEKLLDQQQLSFWDDLESKEFVLRSRATMQEGVRWASAKMQQGKPYYGLIFENVPEVMLWSGITQWYQDLDALGYRCQTVCFNSMHAQAAFPADMAEKIYPVAQSRNRWYVACTLKTNPPPDLDLRPRAWCAVCASEVESVQTWKVHAAQRHWGDYREQYIYTCPTCHNEVVPYYTPASALIDWSLPIQRIGDRARPLAETTQKRIRKGIARYGPGNRSHSFLVDVGHTKATGARVRPLWEVSFTQTQAQTLGVVVPPKVPSPSFTFHTLRTGFDLMHEIEKGVKRFKNSKRRARLAGEQQSSYISSALATYREQVDRYLEELEVYRKSYLQAPLAPAVARDAFVASYYNGSDVLIGVDEALRTCTSVDRHGVCVPPARWERDEPPLYEDWYYRSLKSKETKRAMGIPESYVIEATSQREETRQCGVAVTPAVATLLMHRLLASLGEKAQLHDCI